MDTQHVEDEPLLLTPKESARRLRMSLASLYELMSAGEIESVKIGRMRRIPLEALEEYVARLRRA